MLRSERMSLSLSVKPILVIESTEADTQRTFDLEKASVISMNLWSLLLFMVEVLLQKGRVKARKYPCMWLALFQLLSRLLVLGMNCEIFFAFYFPNQHLNLLFAQVLMYILLECSQYP